MVARRLKDLIKEIEDRALECGDLRRKAVEQNAVAWRRLLLKAIGEIGAQALKQQIEFSRDVADEVASLVVGLERRSPDLAATLVRKACKILNEARDEISLGKQGIDRKIHL